MGDYGFLLGILIVWAMFGSVNFDEIKTGVTAFAAAHYADVAFHAAGLLIFCGAVGKARNSRCTSGCRTRWKARRRSAR